MITQQYLSKSLPWIDSSENYGGWVIEKFLRRIAPFRAVLDIGCGSGRDLSLAHEICPQAVRIALECNSIYMDNLTQKGIECHLCNIERDSFPLENESVDVVIANQVFEHAKEIFWLMHEVMRVLRGGGHLLLGVPNVASLHNRIGLLFGRHPSQAKVCSEHVRIFSRQDTLDFFNAVFPKGIELQAFAGSQFYPFPKSISRILAGIFPDSAYSIFFLLKKARPYAGEFCKYLSEVHLATNFYRGKP